MVQPSPKAARSLVLIGAGSGITPLMTHAQGRAGPASRRATCCLFMATATRIRLFSSTQLAAARSQQPAAACKWSTCTASRCTRPAAHQHTGRLNRTTTAAHSGAAPPVSGRRRPSITSAAPRG
ncbi:MAG: hypothetical protein WKG07_15315 [Hymenobacter sp.]